MEGAKNVECRRRFGGLLTHELALNTLLKREAGRAIRFPVLLRFEREQLAGGVVRVV